MTISDSQATILKDLPGQGSTLLRGARMTTSTSKNTKPGETVKGMRSDILPRRRLFSVENPKSNSVSSSDNLFFGTKESKLARIVEQNKLWKKFLCPDNLIFSEEILNLNSNGLSKDHDSLSPENKLIQSRTRLRREGFFVEASISTKDEKFKDLRFLFGLPQSGKKTYHIPDFDLPKNTELTHWIWFMKTMILPQNSENPKLLLSDSTVLNNQETITAVVDLGNRYLFMFEKNPLYPDNVRFLISAYRMGVDALDEFVGNKMEKLGLPVEQHLSRQPSVATTPAPTVDWIPEQWRVTNHQIGYAAYLKEHKPLRGYTDKQQALIDRVDGHIAYVKFLETMPQKPPKSQ